MLKAEQDVLVNLESRLEREREAKLASKVEVESLQESLKETRATLAETKRKLGFELRELKAEKKLLNSKRAKAESEAYAQTTAYQGLKREFQEKCLEYEAQQERQRQAHNDELRLLWDRLRAAEAAGEASVALFHLVVGVATDDECPLTNLRERVLTLRGEMQILTDENAWFSAQLERTQDDLKERALERDDAVAESQRYQKALETAKNDVKLLKESVVKLRDRNIQDANVITSRTKERDTYRSGLVESEERWRADFDELERCRQELLDFQERDAAKEATMAALARARDDALQQSAVAQRRAAKTDLTLKTAQHSMAVTAETKAATALESIARDKHDALSRLADLQDAHRQADAVVAALTERCVYLVAEDRSKTKKEAAWREERALLRAALDDAHRELRLMKTPTQQQPEDHFVDDFDDDDFPADYVQGPMLLTTESFFQAHDDVPVDQQKKVPEEERGQDFAAHRAATAALERSSSELARSTLAGQKPGAQKKATQYHAVDIAESLQYDDNGSRIRWAVHPRTTSSDDRGALELLERLGLRRCQTAVRSAEDVEQALADELARIATVVSTAETGAAHRAGELRASLAMLSAEFARIQTALGEQVNPDATLEGCAKADVAMRYLRSAAATAGDDVVVDLGGLRVDDELCASCARYLGNGDQVTASSAFTTNGDDVPDIVGAYDSQRRRSSSFLASTTPWRWLSRLDLSNNAIGDLGAGRLATNVVRVAPVLALLNLSKNRISAVGRERLRREADANESVYRVTVSDDDEHGGVLIAAWRSRESAKDHEWNPSSALAALAFEQDHAVPLLIDIRANAPRPHPSVSLAALRLITETTPAARASLEVAANNELSSTGVLDFVDSDPLPMTAPHEEPTAVVKEEEPEEVYQYVQAPIQHRQVPRQKRRPASAAPARRSRTLSSARPYKPTTLSDRLRTKHRAIGQVAAARHRQSSSAGFFLLDHGFTKRSDGRYFTPVGHVSTQRRF